jgi:hypothetical protein
MDVRHSADGAGAGLHFDNQLHGGLTAEVSDLASTASQLREQLKDQMQFLHTEDTQFQQKLSQLGAEVPSSPQTAAPQPSPMVSVPASYAVDGELLRQEAEEFARRTQAHLEDALRVRVAALTESHRREIADMQDENARLRAVVRRMDTEMRHYQASISHGVTTANARMEAMLQDERAGWERKTRALEDELKGMTATAVAQRQQISALRGVEERGQAAEQELEALRNRLSAVQDNTRDSFSVMSEMVAKSRKAELELRQQLEAARTAAVDSSITAAAVAGAPLRTELKSQQRSPSPSPSPPQPQSQPQQPQQPRPRQEQERQPSAATSLVTTMPQRIIPAPAPVPPAPAAIVEAEPPTQQLATASTPAGAAAALMEAEQAQPGPEEAWLSRLAEPSPPPPRHEGQISYIQQDQGQLEDELSHTGGEPEEVEGRSRERVEELAMLAMMSTSSVPGQSSSPPAPSQQTDLTAGAEPLPPTARSAPDEEDEEDEGGLESLEAFRARSARLTVGLGDAIARAKERADAAAGTETELPAGGEAAEAARHRLAVAVDSSDDDDEEDGET